MRKTKRTVRIVLTGFLLVTLATLGIQRQQARHRDALARFQAELRAQGERLSLGELGTSPAPGAADRLKRLLAAVSRIPSSTNRPDQLPLMHFTAPGRAKVCWAVAEPEVVLSFAEGEEGYSIVSTRKVTWQSLEDQVNAASNALEELCASAQALPRHWLSTPAGGTGGFGFEPPWPPLASLDRAAGWLKSDALLALRARDLPRANQAIHALKELALLHQDDVSRSGKQWRETIAGLSLNVTWEALQANGWTEAELAALQQDWEAVDLLETVETAVVRERAWMEANLALLHGGRWPKPLPGRTPSQGCTLLNELVAKPLMHATLQSEELYLLRGYQRLLESIRHLRANEPWTDVRLEVSALQTDAQARLKGGPCRFMFYDTRPLPNLAALPRVVSVYTSHGYLGAWEFVKFTRATQRAVREETLRRLTVTAIALERYRLRHGRLPDTLPALAPEFVHSVPLDPMSGKPLCYHRDLDGTGVLYSVGEDGRDDGGNANPSKPGKGFGLWSGKDAVWPSPVLAAPDKL